MEKAAEKFLKKFIIAIGILTAVIVMTVLVFDPFYHYHKNLPFLKAVLEQRDYEVAGTIDHFDYDAVLLGDSTAENYNNAWLDDAFSATFVKAIRPSSNVADLVYFLDRACESHQVTTVVWSLGTGMMTSAGNTTFKDNKDYYFLVNKNPFDDTKYLVNKDVLLKKIPIQIAYSTVIDYDEGESYNWYSTKNFSAESMSSHYYPQDWFDEEIEDFQSDNLTANIELICNEIESHPDTNFYFYFAPYSALWWDCEYRMGKLESDLYVISKTVEALLGYDNVSFADYLFDGEISLNLDLYMDTVHFNQEINCMMAYTLDSGDKEISNISQLSEGMDSIRGWVESFSRGGILKYYEDAVVE